MTTFTYPITLNDREYIMLKSVLPKHIEHCGYFLDEAPHWAQREACKSLLKKLDDAWENKAQMSGYFPKEEG